MNEILCTMGCKNNAVVIDLKTNEGLCEWCHQINEDIYFRKDKVGKYKEIK